MIRVGLRDARAHFSRFLLSIIAIALGVSFVVGSFCFREMLNNQVDEMMATNADHDVYVRGSEEQHDDETTSMDSDSDTSTATYNMIDTSLTTTISKVNGVKDATADTSVSGVLTLVGKDGNAVSSGMSGVTVAINGKAWRSAHLEHGDWPKNRHEIALHTFALEQSGLGIGDTTTLVYPSGPEDVKIVGSFSTDSSQAGALLIAVPGNVVKDLYEQNSGQSGQTQNIGVYGSANSGSPLTASQQQELADRINKALPRSSKAHAITGDQMRDESSKSSKEMLGFIQPLILIFAVIALFVGSFIIANTFSMIVRESMRGYALLRSIGASSGQVFLTVIIQALILGLVGSVAGIALGWGMVKGIAVLLAQLGTPMTGSVTPTPNDMLVGLVVGIVVAVIGAVLPARRAALAPPIQAMNETVNPEPSVAPRAIAGGIITLIGALSWILCWRIGAADGKEPTSVAAVNALADALGTGWMLGIGAACVVIGMIMVGPALVETASVVLGWIPSLLFPVAGRLAMRNLSRQKRRTSNTAAALFVGVAIVSCLGVVASSVNASVAGIIDSGLKTDYIVSSTNGQIPDKAVNDIKGIKDVKSVSVSRMMMNAKFDGETALAFAEQPTVFSDVMDPVATQGNADRALRRGELVVGEKLAEDRDWKIGDKVTVTCKRVVVDQEATAKAQADYQAQVQAKVQSLQTEAQTLLAAGDQVGAKAKADEAQQAVADAQNVDPATLVKTKDEPTKAVRRIGAIISNSVYRTAVFMNDEQAENLTNKEALFTIMVFVTARHGSDVAGLRGKILKQTKPYYVLTVQDHDEYKSTVSSLVDQMLIVLYALLALSIIIAIFGIVNTLALSVSERTREIGLLRAIGTSKAKIRGMLAIEAALISVLGTVIGLVVGTAAGVVIQQTYKASGMEQLAIPWGQLGVFLLLSIGIGVLASLPPSRRALKAPVLDAVASE